MNRFVPLALASALTATAAPAQERLPGLELPQSEALLCYVACDKFFADCLEENRIVLPRQFPDADEFRQVDPAMVRAHLACYEQRNQCTAKCDG